MDLVNAQDKPMDPLKQTKVSDNSPFNSGLLLGFALGSIHICLAMLDGALGKEQVFGAMAAGDQAEAVVGEDRDAAG